MPDSIFAFAAMLMSLLFAMPSFITLTFFSRAMPLLLFRCRPFRCHYFSRAFTRAAAVIDIAAR